jgi:hypothetical protein
MSFGRYTVPKYASICENTISHSGPCNRAGSCLTKGAKAFMYRIPYGENWSQAESHAGAAIRQALRCSPASSREEKPVAIMHGGAMNSRSNCSFRYAMTNCSKPLSLRSASLTAYRTSDNALNGFITSTRPVLPYGAHIRTHEQSVFQKCSPNWLWK